MSRRILETTWKETIVPVFLERFLLVVCAAAFYGIVISNTMQIDIHYRAGIGVTLVGLAYILGHTVHKTNNPPKPKTSFTAAQEAAKDRAEEIKQPPQRIFLPPDVSAAYLAGLSDGNTQVRVDTMASVYIGKWMTIAGSVDEVFGQPSQPGAEFLVAILVDDPKRQIISILGFDRRWADRLSILRRGSRLKAYGKLRSVSSGSFALEQSELVD